MLAPPCAPFPPSFPSHLDRGHARTSLCISFSRSGSWRAPPAPPAPPLSLAGASRHTANTALPGSGDASSRIRCPGVGRASSSSSCGRHANKCTCSGQNTAASAARVADAASVPTLHSTASAPPGGAGAAAAAPPPGLPPGGNSVLLDVAAEDGGAEPCASACTASAAAPAAASTPAPYNASSRHGAPSEKRGAVDGAADAAALAPRAAADADADAARRSADRTSCGSVRSSRSPASSNACCGCSTAARRTMSAAASSM
eukprot:364685-Chlamydomonas_euryale.AAC.1